jgi:glycosyltransferase involved in cell wall biosynthesis
MPLRPVSITRYYGTETMRPTIRELLVSSDNDYSAHADAFEARFEMSYVEPHCDAETARRLSELVSVVIPSYNGHQTIPAVLAALERQVYRGFEVVLVDDGSEPPLAELIACIPRSYPLHLVRHPRSRGVWTARNVGVSCASGGTVVFLDDDIRVEPMLTGTMAMRMELDPNCLFVGFRENVSLERFAADWSTPPRLDGDWRCRAHDRGTYLALTAAPQSAPDVRRVYHLLEETRDFRDFGRGKTIGYWDLPHMVIGHSMAAKRHRIIAAGGFDESWFSGWGTEDLAFGALMIAAGNYVAPAREWVSYHPRHEGRKVTRHEEITVQLRSNYERYLTYIERRVEDGVFPHRVLTKCDTAPWSAWMVNDGDGTDRNDDAAVVAAAP